MIFPRRRTRWPSLVLAVVAAAVPSLLVLVVWRQRELSRGESELRLLADLGLRRTERILQLAQHTLTRLAADTRGELTPQTLSTLERAVYKGGYFRDARLTDARGMLVCTSFGVLPAPAPLPAEQRADPEVHRTQISGLASAAGSPPDRSLVIALPTGGMGQVDLLIAPEQLIDVFNDTNAGPDGSVALVRSDGLVLATKGSRPKAGETASGPTVELRSESFPLAVVAHSSRVWALRDWHRDLFFVVPVTVLCSALLSVLVMTLTRRPGALDDELRLALRNGEFEPHYQPVVEMATGRCVGAEVLVRWRHPHQGFIRPDLFIAVAEQSGFIEPLTEYLMKRIAGDMRDLAAARPDLHFGVNLSAAHFRSGRILDVLPTIFNDSTIACGRLVFETTERSMIEDENGMPHQVMDGLRRLGAAVAIDDFGTGYSSLSYLHRFRFDFLKIDASFVRRIGADNVTAGLIDSIIDLGAKLGVRLIAEGVETEAQRAYLAARGVPFAQGWLFARAMPADEFRRYLKIAPESARRERKKRESVRPEPRPA